MSEQKPPYYVPSPPDKPPDDGFVPVRTRRGKLVCRIDFTRLLMEWREGKDSEYIDLKPLLS